MQVKIGNKIHDSAKEPILIILTDRDKLNISRMDVEQDRMMLIPNGLNMTEEDVLSWMKLGNKNEPKGKKKAVTKKKVAGKKKNDKPK